MTESIRHLRSEEQFYEDLAALKAEQIVLAALAAVNYARGFTYLEHTAAPVVPLDKHCHIPAGMATLEERWQIGLERDVRAHQLVEEFGGENVWLGPPDLGKPIVPRLTPAEQRGFWVRFGQEA